MSDFAPDVTVDEKDVEIPSTLPVLPLKETVVFPQSMTPLAIGQERSIKLVDDVVSGDRMLALVTVKNEEAEEPGWDDLYDVGTAAIVHKLIRVPDGTLRILVQGLRRIKLERHVSDDPTSSAISPRCRTWSRSRRSSRRSRATSRTCSDGSSAASVPPREAATRGRERRRPECARRTSSPRRCAEDRGGAGPVGTANVGGACGRSP
jgi:ATP-dependent Lon protease